jgi:predicted Zn-dependent peptidase
MGKKIFGRQHQDYPYLNFVTTLLGGYFGSRLVSNIREAKGLTYGIYSMLDTQLYDGCMIISTDVANKNVELCIKEIHKEIKKLCEVPVSTEELNLVKNYFAGTYLNFFDGPFNSLRAIKSLVLNQIPLSDLKSILDISQSITSDQVLDISQKYLNGNDFWEVVVGAPRT